MQYFVGWDVGAWNCRRTSGSQDSFVVLTSDNGTPKLCGRVFRGPLRIEIAEIESLPKLLLQICELETQADDEFVIGIDTPLGLPEAVQWHITREGLPRSVEERCSHNPYLYRKCEQHLAEVCFPPLSAIKDMIGSQLTKGMHFLRKLNLQPQSEPVGAWKAGNVTAIEVYPATCKVTDTKGYVSLGSATLKGMFAQLQGDKLETVDEQDAVYCALVAYLFASKREQLANPITGIPKSEGWIWYPKDSVGRKSKKKNTQK
jgi:predicted nuclease with RNAse H fold